LKTFSKVGPKWKKSS